MHICQQIVNPPRLVDSVGDVKHVVARLHIVFYTRLGTRSFLRMHVSVLALVWLLTILSLHNVASGQKMRGMQIYINILHV
jgi:hypothetical protein